KIKERKEQKYFELAHEKLQAFPGVERILKSAQVQNRPMIVASSGTKKKIRFNLEEAGLKHFFSEFVSADEVEQGKPHPELFLKAVNTLGVPPNECVVFEDSILGIQAGKRARMFVIAVTNTHSGDKLQEADLVIKTFEHLRLKNGLLIIK
ncbi:MAG: HAD family hydrolase, partial [Candidatus Hodarchaeota archaeon]